MGIESPDQYCREIEAYLCRKNDGHLVRIVGPAFEHVTGWATKGVPLTVAYGGIDRYFERYYAKGPRRRPVRVEFCEADVLDAFDEWRRAVGISGRTLSLAEGAPLDADPTEEGLRRHGSLPAHLDRAIARLTALRGGSERALDEVLEAIIQELDASRAGARSLRGDARKIFTDRLRELDANLLVAARHRCDTSVLAQLEAEADAELAPFRDRMPSQAFEQSRRAAVDRLIRERHRLPVVAFD